MNNEIKIVNIDINEIADNIKNFLMDTYGEFEVEHRVSMAKMLANIYDYEKVRYWFKDGYTSILLGSYMGDIDGNITPIVINITGSLGKTIMVISDNDISY
jgi:hypothetical protein